jgi:hypothetical protein
MESRRENAARGQLRSSWRGAAVTPHQSAPIAKAGESPPDGFRPGPHDTNGSPPEHEHDSGDRGERRRDRQQGIRSDVHEQRSPSSFRNPPDLSRNASGSTRRGGGSQHRGHPTPAHSHAGKSQCTLKLPARQRSAAVNRTPCICGTASLHFRNIVAGANGAWLRPAAPALPPLDPLRRMRRQRQNPCRSRPTCMPQRPVDELASSPASVS